MFENLKLTGAVVIATGAVTVMTGYAQAEDWTPPPWERFTFRTTFQEWDFDSPIGVNGLIPDGDLYGGEWFNEGKIGDTPVVFNGGGVAWDNGILYGSGNGNSYIDFNCPNWIDQEPIKYLWIQIHGNWGPTHSDGPVYVSNVWGVKEGLDTYPGNQAFSNDNDAVHLTIGWTLEPNPDSEWIRIFLPEGAQITQVVIDTISIPAPGALAVLGIGGLAVTRRRR